jgi:1-deoxy-D-xylulose-5-phosphate reductoisomerase
MQEGGCGPAIFNAANEVAVARFLAKDIGYLEIPQLIERTLNEISCRKASSLETLLQVDAEARLRARA